MAYYYFDDKSRLNSFLTFFFLLVLLFINPSSVLSKSPRPITVNPIFLSLSLSLSFHCLLWCSYFSIYFLFWSSSSCFYFILLRLQDVEVRQIKNECYADIERWIKKLFICTYLFFLLLPVCFLRKFIWNNMLWIF